MFLHFPGAKRIVIVGREGGPDPIAQILALNPFAFYVAAPQYLFQEEDGTGAVSADGTAVGYVTDLSGNSHPLLQATAAARALYKTSGGLNWLQSDGVDDFIASAGGATPSIPFYRISAFRILADGPLISNGDLPGALFTSPALHLYTGSEDLNALTTPSIGQDFVVVENYATDGCRIAVDNGAYATTTSVLTSNGGTVRLFEQNSGFSSARWYSSVIVAGDSTDPEIALCRTFMASLQGRAL